MTKGVYSIQVRGQTYIGSSSNIERRFREHIYCFTKSPEHFRSSILKDALQWPVTESEITLNILEVTEDYLIREIVWINKLKPKLNTEGLEAIGVAYAIKWLLANPTKSLAEAAATFSVRVKLLYHAKSAKQQYLQNLLTDAEYDLFHTNKYKEFSVKDKRGVVYTGQSFSDMERKYGKSRKTFATYERV